jgi:hypothetical protein
MILICCQPIIYAMTQCLTNQRLSWEQVWRRFINLFRQAIPRASKARTHRRLNQGVKHQQKNQQKTKQFPKIPPKNRVLTIFQRRRKYPHVYQRNNNKGILTINGRSEGTKVLHLPPDNLRLMDGERKSL